MELIPTRPANDADFKIAKADKELLSYVVAMGISNEVAFARWHPEFIDSAGRLNKVGKQTCGNFFRYNKNREYMDAYRATLEATFSRSAQPTDDEERVGINEAEKEQAAQELLSQLIKLVKKNPNDPELIKLAAETYKKYGMLEKGGETVEEPRRYLPALCYRECQYRLFCERGMANGEIVNECTYCKALAYAQERGYKYDPTTNLNLPTNESINE